MNEAQSIRYGKGDAPAGHFGVLYAPRQCCTTAQNIQTQSSDRLIVVSLSSLTHEIQSKVLLSRSVETVSVAEKAILEPGDPVVGRSFAHQIPWRS